MKLVVFAGQGDARRSMSLLWRAARPQEPRTAPGPRPGLSVDAIVDAAIIVADHHGMSALSMRAVGERLGRTAMALYTYVPNKSELVDLMYDKALAELPGNYDLSLGWRSALISWTTEMRDFYLRHPWILQVSQARPVLGPNEYAVLETLATILHETGLGTRIQRGIVGTLFHYVRGAAQTITDARQASAATGVSDEEWWYTRSAILLDIVPNVTERFPMATGLNTGPEPPSGDEPYLERQARDTFEAGLSIVLDGIEAAIRNS